MTTFADALKARIEAKARPTAREKKILALIDAPPSKRRDKRLARMENHARATAGIDPATGAIDWGAFDWKKFFDAIIAILIKLLPLILAA